MDKINEKIYSDLIGSEFKYMARGENGKYDCLGLIYELYKRLSIPLPHQQTVIDKHLRDRALEKGKDMFEKISTVEPGCLIGFRVGSLISHVGMMLDRTRFVHIRKNTRCCIEKITDLKWKKRVIGYYKFRQK